MASGRVSHAAWRELIAARLDRPLTRAETRGLTAHLRGCDACRRVERDYREQRAQLRALSPRLPPRDLWARTSAALDREVARGAYGRGGLVRGRPPLDVRLGGAARRPSAPSAALITTLAAVGVIAAVGVMQLWPTYRTAPPTAPGRPTPFAVDPQQLAFIGSEAADTYVYQTRVGHVCPPTSPDCQVDDGIMRTPVNLPVNVHTRTVAMSPSGEALAFVGRDLNQDLIAVVMLTPGEEGGTESSPAPGSLGPAGTDQPAGTPTGSAGPPETPANPGGPTSPLPEPTVSAPPASAVPGLRVLAILDHVQSAGAPPAWSSSGEMLAFSAMPADGSHGPDVYVWAPSDAQARPITSDHGSYFASWSGERIVASRVSQQPDAGGLGIATVVIDPRTLEERTVTGPALWLPVVNPAGNHAVAWLGQLELEDGLAVPRSGALYMVEWTALDPFGPGAPTPATPAPTDQAVIATDTPSQSPSDAPSPVATAQPTDTPGASPPPTLAPTTAPDLPSPVPTDSASSPDATEPSATPLPAGMVALDLGRDLTSAPVVDWQVRWSVDGQVLGVWIADAAGSTWGRLTVLTVDPATHQVGSSQPLLAPTLARRGFSLGISRVAWVAPSEDNADGELRIRTWGDDGVGGLRLLPSKLEEVVPAF